jgi:cytoskeletal protein RodZ
MLKAAREAQGRTLQQLAETTRVSRAYLAAIEDMRPDLLPSRPFAVGYAKSYARALGLDSEDLAERFKNELPSAEPALRAPVGVAGEDVKSRYPLIIGGIVALLGAVLLWNVAQRAVTFEAPAAPAAPEAPEAWLRTAPPSGPVPLAAPAPAPAEQTIPDPYVTPGLDAFAAARAAGRAQADIPTNAQPVGRIPTETAPPAVPTAAQGAKAKAYGQGTLETTVMLKARVAASIVVKRPDGAVIFARHLPAGDSFRHPPVPGMVVEVSEPSAFDVYAYGRFKGQLAAPVVSLPQLAK